MAFHTSFVLNANVLMYIQFYIKSSYVVLIAVISLSARNLFTGRKKKLVHTKINVENNCFIVKFRIFQNYIIK